MAIQQRLTLALQALTGAVLGNLEHTAQHLQQLAALVQPLLSSPLVGEGPAWDASAALARCLPGPLRKAAPSVATALQLVQLGRGAFTGGPLLRLFCLCFYVPSCAAFVSEAEFASIQDFSNLAPAPHMCKSLVKASRSCTHVCSLAQACLA